MRGEVPSDPSGVEARPKRSGRSYLALAAAVALVVAPLAWWMDHDQRGDQQQTIAALASLYATQVAAAHERLAGDARLLTTAFPLARAYEYWRENGDLAARDLLVGRLAALIADTEFDALALFDPAGALLWASDGSVLTDLAARVASVWPAGARPGATTDLGLVTDAEGRVLVAHATALPTADDGPAPFVVAQASVARLLRDDRHGALRPLPHVQVALLDPVVTGLVVFAPAIAPAPDRGEAVALVVDPAADGGSLFARAFTPEAPAVPTLTGRGPDGSAAIGASIPVSASGWRVLAFASARDLAWARWPTAAVAALLAALLFALGLIGLRWLEDRRRRETLAATQFADAERDRARSLLAAIADASPDAIFAKDLEGRYLFVNRAGASFLGREHDAVVGRDDRALFPPAQAEALMAHDRRLASERTVATAEERVDTVRGPTVFLATKGPLLDGEGRVVGTFGVSRDVTEREGANRALADQARALRQTLDELERFNRTLVDRELAMIELKRTINDLSRRLGEPPPFDLSTLTPIAGGTDA